MILEEIGKLRQQVDQLRTEMHDRFDRIDEGLNAIYTTMNDRFNQIDIQLGQINGNILEVQQSLVALDLKLSRIERNNFEFLNALVDAPCSKRSTVDLETAMHNLSTLASATGPQGNGLLFSKVITQYQNKLDALDRSLQALETGFVDEVRVNRLGRTETFLLHGGVHQVVAYRPAELTTATCGDPQGYGSYSLPSNFERRLPTFNLYNLAEYLKLGKFSTCLADQWLNPVEYCYPPDPERPNDPSDCYYLADHKSILTVYFDGFPILSQTITEPQETMPTSGAESWTRDRWTLASGDYKAKFEAHSLVDQPSPEVAAQRAAFLNAITAKVETALAGYQQELYGRLVREMTSGSLRTLAVEIAGSKALIDSLVTLGLPRAVSSDEFVHAMLYGKQQLVDDSQIVQAYAFSLTQPITGANLTVNPRLVIGQKADERRAAFAGMIDEYLDAITAQTHVEAPDYIANTRRALELTMRIVQIEPAGANNQTISFEPLPDKLVGDPPFSVNAAASSGLPVSLASLTSAICTVNDNGGSGNAVTLITTGTCSLQATQGGNASFNPAPPVTQSFAVKSTQKSDQTLAFAKPADKQLGDLPFALSASASSGLGVSFTSNTPGVCTVSGDTVTLVATGTCTITATQEGNATINPATPVTQSFTVSPQTGGSGGEQKVYLPLVER